MKTRKELIKSKGYWIAEWQLELFSELNKYKEHKKINNVKLAAELGVTKGYISQIMNGNFNHKISTLIELALAIGKVPLPPKFVDIDKYIEKDELGVYELDESEQNINITLNYVSMTTNVNKTGLENYPSAYSGLAETEYGKLSISAR